MNTTPQEPITKLEAGMLVEIDIKDYDSKQPCQAYFQAFTSDGIYFLTEEGYILQCGTPTAHMRVVQPETKPLIGEGMSEVVPLDVLVKEAISNALLVAGGNREKAAQLLGIGERTLYRKLTKYNLR